MHSVPKVPVVVQIAHVDEVPANLEDRDENQGGHILGVVGVASAEY